MPLTTDSDTTPHEPTRQLAITRLVQFFTYAIAKASVCPVLVFLRAPHLVGYVVLLSLGAEVQPKPVVRKEGAAIPEAKDKLHPSVTT